MSVCREDRGRMDETRVIDPEQSDKKGEILEENVAKPKEAKLPKQNQDCPKISKLKLTYESDGGEVTSDKLDVSQVFERKVSDNSLGSGVIDYEETGKGCQSKDYIEGFDDLLSLLDTREYAIGESPHTTSVDFLGDIDEEITMESLNMEEMLNEWTETDLEEVFDNNIQELTENLSVEKEYTEEYPLFILEQGREIKTACGTYHLEDDDLIPSLDECVNLAEVEGLGEECMDVVNDDAMDECLMAGIMEIQEMENHISSILVENSSLEQFLSVTDTDLGSSFTLEETMTRRGGFLEMEGCRETEVVVGMLGILEEDTLEEQGTGSGASVLEESLDNEHRENTSIYRKRLLQEVVDNNPMLEDGGGQTRLWQLNSAQFGRLLGFTLHTDIHRGALIDRRLMSMEHKIEHLQNRLSSQ